MSVWGNAQTLSTPMEKAIEACINLSDAIGATTTSQLKAANKMLKAADIVNFGDLWLEKGKDFCVDGHFIFDEEFVDSLIVNRKVIDFSSHYAKMRSNRASTNINGRIKMTTKAIKVGQSSVWKTVNRRNAEYAIVAEPGGLFTMTIRDDSGNVLYAETVNNKKGAPVRKVKIQLPDKATRIYIEIKNNGKNDASFALLGN
jgi:uncharacterized protein YbcV (DUF1398 family)